MTAIAVQVQAERLTKLLEHAPQRLREEVSDALLLSGIAHEREIKQRRFGPYQGRNGGDRLQRRTGALANAYQLQRPNPTSLEMVAGIRSGVRGSQYARVQEFGGTIRPKNSKFLTVPTEAALTASGAQSGRFKIRKSGDGYTTDAGDTFLFRSKGGAFLIGIKDRDGKPRSRGRGKNRAPIAFYVLRRSVTLKPRLGFFPAWRDIERRLLPRLISRAANRVAREGAGG